MAKYTETLAEYLEDTTNELPTEFEQIEGFKELFVAHFCNEEIGLETEALFKIKLAARAALVIPAYASRITELAAETTKIANPAKTFYEKATTSFGNQKSKTTELPIDALTAEPNLVNESEEYENSNEVERREDGKTTEQVLATLNYLNSKVNIILQALLKEFDSLFMKVY